MSEQICNNDRRRERVRAKTDLNGLDYLEVSDNQKALTVYFLGKLPQQLSADNAGDFFRIEGGRRIRDIEVVGAQLSRNPDPARRRISVRRHARLVDYPVHEGGNARAWVCVQVAQTDKPVTLDLADILLVTNLGDALPAAPRVIALDDLRKLSAQRYEAFEPLVADSSKSIEFRSAHNTLHFYTWGERECCLPKGATSATLLDEWNGVESKAESQNPTKGEENQRRPERRLCLHPGNVLIFEEVKGSRTGDAADADPMHRHAVRLTRVEQTVDILDDTPVVEIQWAEEDALPFPLCLSAIADAEHGCTYHEDISIAHGNVILVDHGAAIDQPETLGTVPTAQTQAECDCAGHPGDVTEIAGRFHWRLAQSPLTFAEPVDSQGPASQALRQDPRKALPNISLTGSRQLGSVTIELNWTPRFDLLGSGRDDRHFVVEMDNEGRANLRFGDGDCGHAPEAGMAFSACYRVGNGSAGNVGGEAIYHLVYRKNKPDGIEGVRNPLPAAGGTDAEPISEVKLFAPWVFRTEPQRAVTPTDYARIAERNPKVQRAAAVLRWTGSWYEMQVAIDPVGREGLTEPLRREIERDLYPFRRMGHDLRILPARYVALDIALEVCVKSDYLRGHVKAALLAVFSSQMLPGGGRGFFHPDSLSFGEGVYLSRIVAAAQAVEGVENVRVTRLQRRFERPDRELENGVLPLGPLEVARCDNDPDFPENGRFELQVLGGR